MQAVRSFVAGEWQSAAGSLPDRPVSSLPANNSVALLTVLRLTELQQVGIPVQLVGLLQVQRQVVFRRLRLAIFVWL